MAKAKYAAPMYLTPEDRDAFVDFPGKLEVSGGMVECPKCEGYGGWNLLLNAYPLHNREDTAENRHRHVHFRASCSQCSGWGWTTPDNVDCIHVWSEKETVGNCLHRYGCGKCGKTMLVDSSD